MAVFNLGDAAQEVSYGWKDLGLPEGSHAVRDLWARKELGTAGSLKGSLAAHAGDVLQSGLIVRWNFAIAQFQLTIKGLKAA